MKAQRIQAAYFVCLAWGMDPTARNINEMLVRITTNGKAGHGLRHQDICAWLRSREPNGNKREPASEPSSVPKTIKREPSQEKSGTLHAGAVKVLELEDIPLLPGVVVGSPSPTPKQPRQIGLGLDRAEAIAASELCGLLWTLIAPETHGITKTGWKNKNMRPARDMVKAGVTQDAFTAAVEAFHEARGYLPKQMQWVQDWLSRSPSGKRRPPKPDWGPGDYWFDEEVWDWFFTSPNDPECV